MMITYSLESGGAERVLSILSNYWDILGHELVIATIVDKESFYPLNSTIKHIRLGIDKESIDSKNMISDNYMRIQKISHLLKNENPEITISFLTTTNILTTIAAKLSSTPVIVSERTNYNFLKSKIWKVLRRVVYPFSDALIVQSAYDKNKYGFHNNCKVIQNPLQISHQNHEIRREKIILAVGRLVEVKGFDMLVEAFSKVNKNDEWKLVILGEGKLRETLEKKIVSLGLESVVSLPGNTKDVEYYYKQASIFVLSSRLEGFPNVLVEAMAYGCAPIAFDCLTGPGDIIENQKNGLLVEAENIKALSKAMQVLISDPKQIIEYGENAKAIEKKLSIDKISNEWLQVIDNILEKDQ